MSVINLSMGDVVSAGALIALVGLVLRNNGQVHKKVDDHKKEIETKYVSKEVDKILHKNLSDDMAEVKERTECIPKIKAGVDLLLQKRGLKNE